MEGQSKTIPHASVDTQLLYERLKRAEIGEFIPYQELTATIDRDVQSDGRGYLNTARGMTLRHDRMVFECVSNQGLRRMNDTEIVEGGTSILQRIRRASRRGAMKLASVKNFDALPNNKKIRHNALLSALGAITHFGRESNVKQIEAKVEAAQSKLPLARTLEIFQKK